MTILVDTNILVYRYDARFPAKQKRATEFLREGLLAGSLRIAHQSLMEFVAAVTKALRSSQGSVAILLPEEARREAEEMLVAFPVLYPNAALFRTALRGAAAYRLSWFDAHLWAYAEHYGLDQLASEDFEHQRVYGNVKITNPLLP